MRSLLDLVTARSALRTFWICLAAAAAAAPLLAAQGRVEALIFYTAFSPFCHQQADRSWSLLGEPLAVCIRCWGAYSGAALGGFFLGGGVSALPLLAASAFCGGTWVLEAAGMVPIPEAVRFAAGGVAGFAAMQFVTRALAGTGQRRSVTVSRN